MSEIARFSYGEDGSEILVEVDEEVTGFERVARGDDGIVPATKKLDDALTAVVPVAERVLETVKGMAPAGGQVEFGIKLSAEAGAIFAKASGEANISVTLKWGSA